MTISTRRAILGRVPPAPYVAAIINTSPDVVDMLRVVLEQAGIVVVSAFTHEIRDGHVDLERLLSQHKPNVIVYDIAPPYAANWQLYQHLSESPSMQQCQVVLTSTNPARVTELSGEDRRVYEIVGKPFDLDVIVRAVKEAIRARPTR